MKHPLGFTTLSRSAAALFALALTGAAHAQVAATDATRSAHAAFVQSLPFDDTRDIDDARRGFLAPLPDNGVVRKADGTVAWDLSSHQYVKDRPAPDTVNPSLWRHQQMLAIGGLFEVVPGIYQVRGVDVSNLTIVEGKTGLIVIDPVMSTETAKVAMDLYRAHRGDQRPVKVVIYTHSHADHFGGVRGLIDEADVVAGKVQIVAPEGFVDELVSENVYAGNHMLRRASYQFGNLLPRGPGGSVGAGIGLSMSAGSISMIRPTVTIGADEPSQVLDGLHFDFLFAPGTEAPAEMHFYIREYRALTAAENINRNQHNVQTLRGAKPRDALGWAKSINATLQRWGAQSDVLYGPHTWPVWGTDRVIELLKMQRDLYKYLNDQTLRMANLGYNMTEAAEAITLPPELGRFWANRDYYGTISHNVKGVWTYYLGWYDGNPARLQPLPPASAGARYVEYMGGADKVIERARKDFAAGDYRWVAQVLDQVVMADPKNGEARALLADALTQLGYQAESAIWRNFYLTGALELRNGVKRAPVPDTLNVDMMGALTVEQLLDAVAIRLDGAKAQGKSLAINLNVTDTREHHGLLLEHAVLNTVTPVDQPDLELTLPKMTLLALVGGKAKLADLVKAGKVEAKGDRKAFDELVGMLDAFDPWWEVVGPHGIH